MAAGAGRGPAGSAASPFDVVALVTSAGGLAALSQVLLRLPGDFAAAVVVVQHLGGPGSNLVEILRRRSPLPVEWIADHDVLKPGQVHICPPRRLLEVLPDGECLLRPMEADDRLRPIDFFLISLADSYGPRALAVVLTGMGRDSVAGALAVSQAGGTVAAQSAESADHPGMPTAVARSGAADLVLPLPEIGLFIADVVSGDVLSRPLSERAAVERLFVGPGEMPALLRDTAWPRTPFGAVSQWPDALRTSVRGALDSPLAVCVLWGPDHRQLYNDQYRLMLGVRHPAALGQPSRECWPEAWPLSEPVFARVGRGEAVTRNDVLFPLERRGSLEDAWFDLSYSPVRDADGQIAGTLCVAVETTAGVLPRRRLATLQALATATAGAETSNDAFRRAVEALSVNDRDIPFAIGYQLDAAGSRAQLAGTTGVPAGGPMAPYTVEVASPDTWPIRNVRPLAEPVLAGRLAARFRGAVAGPDGRPPSSALLLPLSGGGGLTGVLILGVSSLLPFDAAYRDFLTLVGRQTEAALADAGSRAREHTLLQQTAELERAKTEFFSNISHEFRTPLTLLLSPLDELARRRDEVPRDLAAGLDAAARNARRLLTLVDTLLDFSQLEAGRLRASFQPADLAALTTDIAGIFRGAAERAGLRLRVDCPPLPEPVWIDRDMWEKIVSNLLSNALKHTFQGEIAVELRSRTQHAELTVRDSGVGIPADELPHIFKRFHRVRNARARSHEGSGMGLSLTQELIHQHGGRIRVRSSEGTGTTFTVWVPASPRDEPGRPPEAAAEGEETGRGSNLATALALAASRWDPPLAGPGPSGEILEAETAGADPVLRPRASGAHVLVADDNADMRAYLARLLGARWRVTAAKDGEEALRLARRLHPDLVLADVMMPQRDGVSLLRALRAEPGLQDTPVLLLTARVGHDAAVDGLLAGADDYIAKPFSARELVARVGGQIVLARVRRES
ncbi:MAG TPA: chemotaxis protein CheB, partial [Trebonia sp.]